MFEYYLIEILLFCYQMCAVQTHASMVASVSDLLTHLSASVLMGIQVPLVQVWVSVVMFCTR